MSSDLSRWRGRTALVTGASSGIGRALAKRLVGEGLTVVAAGRNESKLEALASELGPKLIPVPIDVRDEASIRNAVGTIEQRCGALHVFVNNAGLGYQESLLDGDTERWREMLEVNVLGLCVCTREALRLMRKTGQEGHIFHLGSLSGHRPVEGGNVYAATKYAVRSLTESLRRELLNAKLPIRVTAVSPGFVQTGFHERFFDSRERSTELYSRYRVLQPDDIADAIAYALATPPHVQFHDLLVRCVDQPT